MNLDRKPIRQPIKTTNVTIIYFLLQLSLSQKTVNQRDKETFENVLEVLKRRKRNYFRYEVAMNEN